MLAFHSSQSEENGRERLGRMNVRQNSNIITNEIKQQIFKVQFRRTSQ